MCVCYRHSARQGEVTALLEMVARWCLSKTSYQTWSYMVLRVNISLGKKQRQRSVSSQPHSPSYRVQENQSFSLIHSMTVALKFLPGLLSAPSSSLPPSTSTRLCTQEIHSLILSFTPSMAPGAKCPDICRWLLWVPGVTGSSLTHGGEEVWSVLFKKEKS